MMDSQGQGFPQIFAGLIYVNLTEYQLPDRLSPRKSVCVNPPLPLADIGKLNYSAFLHLQLTAHCFALHVSHSDCQEEQSCCKPECSHGYLST